jgi:hypothetical protein
LALLDGCKTACTEQCTDLPILSRCFLGLGAFRAGVRFLFWGLCIEPRGELGVSALAREVGCGLAGIVYLLRIGSMRKKQFGQIAAVCAGGGEDGREAAGLGGVDRRAVLEEKVNRLGILAEGEGGVERLVLLRVAADGVDAGLGGEESRDGFGCGECGGEVERGPAIAGVGMDQFRLGGQEGAQMGNVADGGGFKEVERDSDGGEAGEEEIADQRLAAIDGPEEGGDALRIAPGDEGGVGLNLVGDFGGGTGLD